MNWLFICYSDNIQFYNAGFFLCQKLKILKFNTYLFNRFFMTKADQNSNIKNVSDFDF